MGHNEGDPMAVSGDIIDEEGIERMKSYGSLLYKFSYFPRIFLPYILGDHQHAMLLSEECLKVFKIGDLGPIYYTMIIFLRGLCCISIARKSKYRFNRRLKKLLITLKLLSEYQPNNFLGKYLILKAEVASLYIVNNTNKTAITKYIIAISITKENNSMFEYALANELAAKYLLYQRNNKPIIAEKYIRQAIATYNQWGAIVKVQQLRNEMQKYKYKDL